jgi:hypothetical protein
VLHRSCSRPDAVLPLVKSTTTIDESGEQLWAKIPTVLKDVYIQTLVAYGTIEAFAVPVLPRNWASSGQQC